MPNNFSNFNKFLKPDFKLTFNGFGLDKRDVFSVKAGVLNVAYLLHCIQGDHHEIEPVSMIQTDGFNQANFTRMSQHIDYFFVPYTAIKSQFNEWFQQTTDPVNSLLQDAQIQSDDFLPHVKLNSLVYALCYCQSLLTVEQTGYYFRKIDEGTTNEFDVHDYCGTDFLDSIATGSMSYLPELLPCFIDSNNKLRKDKFGYPIFLNTVRLLDQCRYGNFLPVIKLPIFTDNDSVVKATPGSSSFDSDIISIAQDFDQTFLPSIDCDVNVLALAAYQSVCHNYFVNTYYERPRVDAYNFDDLIDESSIVNRSSSHEDGNVALFSMNYRPWKKDIFLSALPSPQFGDVSVVTVLSDHFERLSGTISSNQQLAVNTSGTPYLNGVGQTSVGQFVGNFSVIDQVKAEALQYWKQQVGRAGFRTRDRFRATFGREPGFDPQVLPVPIGSVYSNINKDTVVGTSGDQFGDKCATGSSLLQNEKIVFDCPSFGIIIGLLSILPEADYDAFGVDKHHTYFDPFDFPTPQLQNLGLVPMNVRQLSVYSDAYYSGNGQVLGYVPEYSEDKTAVDHNHGEFCSMPASFMRSLKVSPVGAFQSFVSSRVDMESFVGTVRQFYVDPAVLDPLFLENADAEQNTDQFKVVFYSRVRSYRPLHVLGLPQF